LRDLPELGGVDLTGLVHQDLFHVVAGVGVDLLRPSGGGLGDDRDVPGADFPVVQSGTHPG
jgi:hypothetical protein